MNFKKSFSIFVFCFVFSALAMEKSEKSPLDGMVLKWRKEGNARSVEAFKNGNKVAWVKAYKRGNIKSSGEHDIVIELFKNLFGDKEKKEKKASNSGS